MSDDTKKKLESLNRRDTLKLATALSALGVGLGVTLDAAEAGAETHKLDHKAIGVLSLKFYKEQVGKPSELLHSIDIGATALKLEPGRYSFKLTNMKHTAHDVVAEHYLEVTNLKLTNLKRD